MEGTSADAGDRCDSTGSPASGLSQPVEHASPMLDVARPQRSSRFDDAVFALGAIVRLPRRGRLPARRLEAGEADDYRAIGRLSGSATAFRRMTGPKLHANQHVRHRVLLTATIDGRCDSAGHSPSRHV
jgi:hypothetical protein